MALYDDRKKPLPPNRRMRMNDATRDLMFAALIRNDLAYSTVRLMLKVEHFKPVSEPMAVLWVAVNRFYAENQGLPDGVQLAATLSDMLAENPGVLTDPELDTANQLIEWAFEAKLTQRDVEGDRYAAWAIRKAKEFLEERFYYTLRDTAVLDDTFISSLPEQARRINEEVERISSLSADMTPDSYADDWLDRPSFEPVSCGVGFIDAFLGGGHSYGEVYGLLGPYGSCKSTIAYMLAVNAARHGYAMTKSPDYDNRPILSFIASYEDELPIMRFRSLGYCAEVPMATMQHLNRKTFDTMVSDSEHLKEYEKIRYHDALTRGEPVMGERERILYNKEILNQHLVFLDMTGASRPGAGMGGMDEVAMMIRAEIRKRNARCGLLVLDYVGAMAKRYIMANNMDLDRQLRHQVGGAPLAAKTGIASVFNCPVYLIHQFTGAANSKGAGVLSDHSFAAEAKNFGENCSFCFSVSKPNLENLALFGCTKHRRRPGRKNSVIFVDGEHYKVDDVDNRFVLEGRGIIPRGYLNQVATGASPVAAVSTFGGASSVLDGSN